MKKRCIYLFFALLIFAAGALIGCGKNDAGKQTGATSEQPSTEDPSATDEPTITDDSFFEKIKGSVDETEFSRSGDFYQNKLKEEFVEVERIRKGLFRVKIFADYSDDCPFSFTCKADAGTFVTEAGETETITVSAGDTFTWKVGAIGKYILEHSDKSYNTYMKYYKNGRFQAGYTEYQYIDIVAGYEGATVGYGSFSFYCAAENTSSEYGLARFLFLPKVDGNYQRIDEIKFAKAKYTARVFPKDVKDERFNTERFCYGTSIWLYPPDNIGDGLIVYLNAEVRDRLFADGITFDTLGIDPAEYGVDESKLRVKIPTYAYFVGYDGVDGGYFQVSIDTLAYSHEEKGRILHELYDYLWTLDYIEYVSFAEASSAD